ncbi:Transposase [Shigella dysenteriae 1617]|uniref:Transposase n=1 Tax=Shigella dysenteriae 1617 TaxID=754093 RepID=A0A0A6ZPI9_SHIDY|nr:Transposase [Shigella dysenteriae 1617]
MGMWLAENEGVKFWLNVLTELKKRGWSPYPRDVKFLYVRGQVWERA